MKNTFFFVWAGAWFVAVIHVWRPEESGIWKLAVLATAYFFFLCGCGLFFSVLGNEENRCERRVKE